MKRVKICGITGEQEIEWLNEYKPDFAGFVLFFPKSRRNIELEKAAELIRLLSPDIETVAVAVKPTAEQVKAIKGAGFDYIQIHGEVPDEVLQAADLKIWKAFNVTDLSE